MYAQRYGRIAQTDRVIYFKYVNRITVFYYPLYIMEKNNTYRSVLNNLRQKIYGTTIYIGQTELDTIYGPFTAFTFQDLIHKGYIIALCRGDLSHDILFTRMHSSCVTSETMRSLDCDCVSQLYGALKKISENNGILFYLIQEGRGCGYVGKSRACMNVQYLENTSDEINTFQAYESLGMVHDYRQYNNVKEILHLMKINPNFTLLTNNPDKIEKFKSLELCLNKVETIEITPNPFNQQYLHSKEKYGHILYQTKTKVTKYIIPHKKVEPFKPYALSNAERFIHVSSYYLPIKPTWGKVLISSDEFSLLKSMYPDTDFPFQALNEESYYVQVSEDIINDNPDLLCKPYWFKVNVFYDIVTHSDYLLLEYGMKDPQNTPIVRIHSESIFNRFPLTDRLYKYRYKRSLEHIVRNGSGVILILYHDGRGSGLGYYVLNSQKEDEMDIMKSQDFIDTLGVEEDRRDYFGALTLLKTYSLNSERPTIDVIHGETSYPTLKSRMQEHNINVRRWINVDHQTDMLGHESIYTRMTKTPGVITELDEVIQRIDEVFRTITDVKKDIKFVVTGIGSSEAHARYLSRTYSRHSNPHINTEYVSLPSIQKPKSILSYVQTYLILFTQGLSPNSICALQTYNYQNVILVTSYDPTHSNRPSTVKDKAYAKLLKSESSYIITYPQEEPDNTLIRITGPYIGYVLANSICTELSDSYATKDLVEVRNHINTLRDSMPIPHRYISRMLDVMNNNEIPKIVIIAPPPISDYCQDLRNRFMEGAFVDVTVCNTIEFAHGYYQYLEYARGYANTNVFVIYIRTNNAENIIGDGLTTLLNGYANDSLLHEIKLESSDDLVNILTLTSIVNDMVYQLMQGANINQKSWPGKDTQSVVYDVVGVRNEKDVVGELERLKTKYE
jgi:3,4-dihydroxy 2-butanone 4-phosphate synthase / GTP cyclohydrolase II